MDYSALKEMGPGPGHGIRRAWHYMMNIVLLFCIVEVGWRVRDRQFPSLN